MKEAFGIFVVGLGGVFAGMALLYIVVRVVALVADRTSAGKEA